MEDGDSASHDDSRFGLTEEHPQCSSSLLKKRKYEQQNRSLPPAKHKFGDRPCDISDSSDGSSSVITEWESDDISLESETCNELQSSEFSPRIEHFRSSAENPVLCSPSSTADCLHEKQNSSDEILPEAADEALDSFDDYIGELTTFSDELPTDLSLYSSPAWAVHGGSRKPTIDEEFEQYFSGLML